MATYKDGSLGPWTRDFGTGNNYDVLPPAGFMGRFVFAVSIALIVLLSFAVTGVAASSTHVSGAAELNARTACKAGSVPASVGGARVCLRVGAKCRARYERAYEKKGFRCVAGRLRKKPREVPPPAPPPAALEGRYVFTTSQANAGTVNILPGGQSFSNLVIPYRAQCSDGSRYLGILSTKKDLVVPLDLTLSFSQSGPLTHPEGTFNIDMRMHFDNAGSVSGSLVVTINQNSGVNCDTGGITFSGNVQPTG